MERGTVKYFNTEKGYGFIEPDNGSQVLFVHISAAARSGLRTLTEGEKVLYDVVVKRGMPSAGNLELD